MKSTPPDTQAPASAVREFFRRFRIGLALVAGYLLGSWLRAGASQNASELFVIGFGAGVILTQGSFWLWDRCARRDTRSEPQHR